MTIFKFLDLAFQLVLGVVDGLTNVVSSPVGFFRGDFLVRLAYLLRRLFRAPPGFLHRTLHLVEDSLVGQFIVANGLTNVLLYLSNSLVNFSSNLILIHGRLSSLGLNRNYLGDMSGGGHRRRVRNFPASVLSNPSRGLLVTRRLAGRRNILRACALKDLLRSLGLVRTIRVNGQENSAVFDAALIPLGFILGDSHSNEGTRKTADRASDAGSRKSCHNRSGSYEGSKSRNRQGTYSHQPSQSSAQQSSGSGARRSTLWGLGALLVGEVLRPLVFGK